MTPARPFWLTTALLWGVLGGSACPSNTGAPADPADAGNSDDEKADGGVDYDGPPYEWDDGFFPATGLHTAPARCDKSPYRWWGVEALGDILVQQRKHDFSIEILEGFVGLLRSQGFADVQRPPEQASTLFRIQYQTQDRGSLTPATGMVAYPDVTGPLPILLYMHGTAGFSDACAPSSDIDSFFSPNYFNAAIVGLIASYGFIVVAPDYLGLSSIGPSASGHPYLLAEPTALASIDAVRAAKKLVAAEAPTIEPGDLVSIGASQGGHGAAFVTQYLPHYAPELTFVGGVYQVPPLDLVGESLAALASDSPTNIGNAAVSTAASHAWYEYDVPLSDAIRPPRDTETLDAMATQCRVPNFPPPITDTFLDNIIGNATPPWQCAQLENSLLHTSVPPPENPAPVLVITGENDALVSSATERAAVTTLCEAGAPVHHIECADAGHVESVLWALDDALNFVEAAVNGTPFGTPECVLSNPTPCLSQP